jgi:hypothetical protein
MINKTETLKRSYINLLEILEKHGRGEIDIQIRQVRHILDFLINISSKEDEEEIISEVRKMHESLFPPRGGLSDFFIWSNDYDERIRLNEPLENVRKEIYNILNN